MDPWSWAKVPYRVDRGEGHEWRATLVGLARVWEMVYDACLLGSFAILWDVSFAGGHEQNPRPVRTQWLMEGNSEGSSGGWQPKSYVEILNRILCIFSPEKKPTPVKLVWEKKMTYFLIKAFCLAVGLGMVCWSETDIEVEEFAELFLNSGHKWYPPAGHRAWTHNGRWSPPFPELIATWGEEWGGKPSRNSQWPSWW